MLDDWQPVVGRWVTIISLVAIINLGLMWLDVPGFVALIPIPIALAAALFSLSVAVATAIGQTMLFLLLFQYIPLDVNLPTIVTILIAIWVMLGLMCVVYRAMYQMPQWS
jgi:hypothetical protein